MVSTVPLGHVLNANRDLRRLRDLELGMWAATYSLNLSGLYSREVPINGHKARTEAEAYLIRAYEENEVEVDDALIRRLEHGVLRGRGAYKDDRIKALVGIARRDYKRRRALNPGFLEKQNEVINEALLAWEAARERNEYSIFQPKFEKVVRSKRKEASLVRRALGFRTPYDALLDSREPGMTQKYLDLVLPPLKRKVTRILRKIYLTDKEIGTSFLDLQYPLDQQLEFVRRVMEGMGIDQNSCRVLLVDGHPSTTRLSAGDVRITTKFGGNFYQDFLTGVHEGGHALYYQEIPDTYTRLDEPRYDAADEAMAKFWERMIATSFPFWYYWYHPLQTAFIGNLPDVSLMQFYEGLNAVRPGPIRTKADELTYIMHIILRYEIERGLISGSINTGDIPNIWNKRMESCLGIEPKNLSEGCMQDDHWACGDFGYFPLYVLGSIVAAHLYHYLETRFDLEKDLKAGNLTSVSRWLRDNIHSHGAAYDTFTLVERATAEPLNPQYYLDHLERKYGKIYGF